MHKILDFTYFPNFQENAALCDQVSQMQENLLAVKEERLYLLRKLYQLQGEVEPGNAMTKMNASHSNSHNNPDGTTGKKAPKKKASVDSQGELFLNLQIINYIDFIFHFQIPSVIPNTVRQVLSEPKNKSKRATKTTRKVVQLIPLDLHGRPIFPIKLGNLTVYSLGEVVSDRITYHTEDLIYPVGYCSTRIYASLRDPSTKSLYTCKILDGGLKPRSFFSVFRLQFFFQAKKLKIETFLLQLPGNIMHYQNFGF